MQRSDATRESVIKSQLISIRHVNCNIALSFQNEFRFSQFTHFYRFFSRIPSPQLFPIFFGFNSVDNIILVVGVVAFHSIESRESGCFSFGIENPAVKGNILCVVIYF